MKGCGINMGIGGKYVGKCNHCGNFVFEKNAEKHDDGTILHLAIDYSNGEICYGKVDPSIPFKRTNLNAWHFADYIKKNMFAEWKERFWNIHFRKNGKMIIKEEIKPYGERDYRTITINVDDELMDALDQNGLIGRVEDGISNLDNTKYYKLIVKQKGVA